MKKEWLTPEELAQLTGYSRQTINKWIKRENWTTAPKPGVQGGKARIIHIDDRVTEFLKSTRHAAEPSAAYMANPATLSALLVNSIQQMSLAEQNKLAALLLREGVQGLLQRLGISEN
ncbi:putative DNA-binding transcriptional regulator [Paramixta manurensis]|uniref:Putative DNA-binding transcriptional regulator n=1 Tax=Paramixta manurensis TaxID=2740817 RepID=A0A6M8UE96_9GAMM|nr:putative DNA-binding transcriptional regulator [Erwiniaceae bacterium PD-1]